jgi:hypothetical protein
MQPPARGSLLWAVLRGALVLLIAYQGSFYVEGFSAVGSHLKVSGPQRVTSEIKANAGHSIIVGRAALATFRC